MPDYPPESVLPLWPWLIFVTVCGACIGSFLNVVILRFPAGESIVHPPSRCPRCGHGLAWYDNIPVLGWLILGGKCRYCKEPISVQYPLIEALCAFLFGGLFLVLYRLGLRPDWMNTGLENTWPALLVYLALVGGLVAVTVIDARHFIIPLPVPWVTVLLALVLLPAGVGLYPPMAQVCPVVPAWHWGGAIIGAVAGLGVANGLLYLGVIPRSFADEETLADKKVQECPATTETAALPASPECPTAPDGETGPQAAPAETPLDWLNYPHPRREVWKECLFLLPVALGAVVGRRVGVGYWIPAGYHPVLDVLAGVIMGYLIGAGLVWITRILGTLGFNKEAMGLGDMHLLAAIGAVLGPWDTVFVFFVAPFLGLTYVAIAFGINKLARRTMRVIPYGPYIAAATLLVIVFRRSLLGLFGIV